MGGEERSGRSHPRWVVKLGTGILSTADGELDLPQIRRLVEQIAWLKRAGWEIVLVSSGAIGSGMGLLGHRRRPAAIEELQACAAVGQPQLMRLYEELFSERGLHVAQLLLTYLDLDSRTLYENAQKTIEHLLVRGIFIPIINENDVVSYEEIKFGDNDRLSAHVASMVKADKLIILSNVPGLQERNDGSGKIIPLVEEITEEIEAMAGKTRSERSVGGMVTKIEAARIAGSAGIPMQIADGRAKEILQRIASGESVGTLFSLGKKR
ncbi:glutamate 5-kinase [Methylacidimicrobium cyclopophantes]|uniref:Glutamate 5-kinase n=1 Tax=Methylacidimicrobium cyclopophantes TaxID=1041766 RepID=A0A5E6MG28_9BACT|nr:glutamate 5-kinase [Methylacidimicrobium cyclopophantes]VVM07962.1 glutamate 5-kinase [Methylacidimicrobium cyclopophantes]